MANAGQGLQAEAKRILSLACTSLPPPIVVLDLLSVGVCVRCIFRLFGVNGLDHDAFGITASALRSYMEEQEGIRHASEGGLNSNGLIPCSHALDESEKYECYCSICLGILQLVFEQAQERTIMHMNEVSVNEFTAKVAELVKQENHQIDGFSIEISIPPVVMANERSIKMYMTKKYESEGWFRNNFGAKHISVKDALRSLITTSLENHLNVTCGTDSFLIRLTCTHFEASEKLKTSLSLGYTQQKRKTENREIQNQPADSYDKNLKDSMEHPYNESDAVILRALESLQNHDGLMVPPEKARKPCHLITKCYRTPIYIAGRYLKGMGPEDKKKLLPARNMNFGRDLSRKVSQSRWIIDDERMGEASVEEIIGNDALLICQGDSYKFHAAGREDIDVRMLGSGRPFLVEITNSHCVPSRIDVDLIARKINNFEQKYVQVKNLSVIGSEAWSLMREGEAEKQKQYAALVWISRPLTDEDLKNLTFLHDLEIIQRTPVRVLHRRSPLERKRVIHWMMVERICSNQQYFLLHLCTQAGTYIKEFVHGDLGRTNPSIGSILDCRAEILQLDVTDVKMDLFN